MKATKNKLCVRKQTKPTGPTPPGPGSKFQRHLYM